MSGEKVLAPDYRHLFHLPDNIIYLDGNSLGPLPRATVERQAEVITRQWGERLIRSWNEADWIGAPQRIGAKIAALIGAKPHEVIVADSTSTNVFKLIAAAVLADPARGEVVTEAGNFPTDLHVAQGAAASIRTMSLKIVARDDLAATLGPATALLTLSEVDYRSGYRHDMTALTAAAHDAGALALWDLSHSSGAIEVDLNAANADLAVGCGYKYLNGGPGAPAFLFVAERHQARLANPLSGWMGHARPFDFSDDYVPASGIDRFLTGTPAILGLAALESGVDLWADVDRTAVFAKGQALWTLFAERVEARCAGHGLRLVTPADPARRGSHISFAHPHAYEICQALIARGVIGDFRTPDIARFGITPLYLGVDDIVQAVDHLAAVMDKGEWRDPVHAVRAKVT